MLRKAIDRQIRNPNSIVFVLSILIIAISLWNHEPWLDEAEAPNRLHLFGLRLWDLMESFRGDGHFPLYHLLLFPIFHGGRSLGLDAFSLVKFFTFLQYVFLSVLACRWLIFPYSALLLSSYYVIFEYGTISRCYLLAVIFLFIIFRSILSDDKPSPWLMYPAYGLFPLTQPLSLIFAIPLLGYSLLKRHWGRVVAFVAGMAIAFHFLAISNQQDPFSQYEYLRSEPVPIKLHIENFFKFLLSSWAPLSTSYPHWWDDSFFKHPENLLNIWSLLLLALLSLMLIRLYYTNSLLTLACLASGLMCFAILLIKFPAGNFRHTGYIAWPFILLLSLVLSDSASLYRDGMNQRKLISANELSHLPDNLPQSNGWIKLITFAGIALLTLQSFAGMVAVSRDISQPFAPTMAQFKLMEQLSLQPEAFRVVVNPCFGFLPVVVASNWRYQQVSSLWHPDVDNCVDSPKNASTFMEQIKFPERFILHLWQSTELNNNQIFNFLKLNKLHNKSISDLFQEKSISCQVIGSFENVVSVPAKVYDCGKMERENL